MTKINQLSKIRVFWIFKCEKVRVVKNSKSRFSVQNTKYAQLHIQLAKKKYTRL